MNTAARYAEVATASTPTMIDVGFSQLENRSPGGVADGHAPRGDRADDGAERERREHGGQREHEVDAAALARAVARPRAARRRRRA